MHSLKFFLKCCCDSSAGPEENKSEKLPSNLRIEKRSLTPKQPSFAMGKQSLMRNLLDLSDFYSIKFF